MADSANIVTLSGSKAAHIARINKTEANCRSEGHACQDFIETDTLKRAYKDQNGGYHTHVVEDTDGKVAIGNGATTARSEFDLYGSMFQTKTISTSESAIREAVGNLTAYAGSNATRVSLKTGVNITPIKILDNILMPHTCDLSIVPNFSDAELCSFIGKLHIFGQVDIPPGVGQHSWFASYRGDFNIYWYYDDNTGLHSVIETIHNYNSNIGVYDGETGFDLIVPSNAIPSGSGYVRLKNNTAYYVQVYYKFEGAVQIP